MRFKYLAAAFALAAPFAVAGEGVREAASTMRHADGDFHPGAHGGISIRTGPDFERFSVGVEGVSELVALKVRLGDGRERFVEIGTLAAGHSNRRLDFTTHDGHHLPLDAAHAGDLSGRGVHVVDGEGHLVLVGEVPHFGAHPPVDEPRPAEPVSARVVMQRAEGATLREARGVVVATHGEHGDSLRCEVGRLAPETGYLLYVGDGDAAVLLDDMRTNGEGGARIVREAAAGAALSNHVGSLADIEGRRVELRDLDGHVVLYGHVPGVETPHDAEPVRTEHEVHDDATGADVRVEVRIRPDVGHETIRLRMRDLPLERTNGARERTDGTRSAARRRARADVLVDDGAANLEQVASVRVGRGGRAQVRFTTRRGGRLPLGAATLREIAGRGFEVRVNGRRAVGGNLPTF